MEKSNIKKLKEILYGSKEYSFDGTTLNLKGYYSGERISLDLSVLFEYEDIVDEMVENAEEEWY